MRRLPGWFLAGSACVAVIVIGAAVLLAGQPTTPSITRLQATMARALDEDFHPVEPTGVFLPRDTFYLSVRVDGAAAPGVVTARWLYRDAVITVQNQSLGSEVAVYVLGFELRRTDAAWPEGDYSVELLLNGQSAGEVYFTVRQPE